MDIAHGLIVSCQGPPGTRLDDPQVMAAMAAAADAAGAVGIRAEGVADIRAIRRTTSLPIIGLLKREVDETRWITPTAADAKAVADAGADVVAIDATARPRPDGSSSLALLDTLLESLGTPIWADVSTLDEGIAAEEHGAAAVLSTLAGYTPYSRRSQGPDLELVSELSGSVAVPVIAEGRYHTPDQVSEAMRRGARAVVVGTAITNPLEITRRFVAAID